MHTFLFLFSLVIIELVIFKNKNLVTFQGPLMLGLSLMSLLPYCLVLTQLMYTVTLGGFISGTFKQTRKQSLSEMKTCLWISSWKKRFFLGGGVGERCDLSNTSHNKWKGKKTI